MDEVAQDITDAEKALAEMPLEQLKQELGGNWIEGRMRLRLCYIPAITGQGWYGVAGNTNIS